MRVLQMVELIAVIGLVWILANLIRYFFFKESPGGVLFSLSKMWIEEDKKKNGKKEN